MLQSSHSSSMAEAFGFVRHRRLRYRGGKLDFALCPVRMACIIFHINWHEQKGIPVDDLNRWRVFKDPKIIDEVSDLFDTEPSMQLY
jgi:hypothetical protein